MLQPIVASHGSTTGNALQGSNIKSLLLVACSVAKLAGIAHFFVSQIRSRWYGKRK